MSGQVESAGWRGKLAGGALLVSIAGVLWFVAAAVGTKYGLWSWQFGLGQMIIGWGPIVAFGALGLSVIACIAAVIANPRKRPLMLALPAFFIAAFTAGRLVGFGATAGSLPPIHDVSTDWEYPVMFSDNLMNRRLVETCDSDGDEQVSEAERASCPLNTVEPDPVISLSAGAQERWPGFDSRRVADVQADHEQDPAARGADDEDKPYPPMNTLVTDMSQTDAFDIVLEKLKQDGYWIVGANHAQGRIEATWISPWFGFKDDVAFRILENEDGQTEIDMRSVSRVGLSDLGANARRVGTFMYELDRVFSRPRPQEAE